jgi:hypothetical protein
MLGNVTPTWRKAKLERMPMQLLKKLRKGPERRLT